MEIKNGEMATNPLIQLQKTLDRLSAIYAKYSPIGFAVPSRGKGGSELEQEVPAPGNLEEPIPPHFTVAYSDPDTIEFKKATGGGSSRYGATHTVSGKYNQNSGEVSLTIRQESMNAGESDEFRSSGRTIYESTYRGNREAGITSTEFIVSRGPPGKKPEIINQKSYSSNDSGEETKKYLTEGNQTTVNFINEFLANWES